jgi:hypothetical protein
MAGLYNGLAGIGAASARAGVWASYFAVALFCVIMPLVILFRKPSPPLKTTPAGRPGRAAVVLPETRRARVTLALVSALVGGVIFAVARFNASAAASSKPYAAYRGASAIADLFMPRRAGGYNNGGIDFDQLSYE